jgi:hypothetical protein
LNFGQTVWDKSEVLLGTSWGTPWENIGNKAKANKSLLAPPLLPQSGCVLSLLIDFMKLLFPKLFVTIFDLG